MRKDIVATKAVEIFLYTDAYATAGASVNLCGDDFNVSNLGMDSRNALFADTSKHIITIVNADSFADETDFVLLSFDVTCVVFILFMVLLVLNNVLIHMKVLQKRITSR